MGEAGTPYLVDILALLLATVIVVPFFHAIRLGAILGYLAAGVLLGPWGFGLISEVCLALPTRIRPRGPKSPPSCD